MSSEVSIGPLNLGTAAAAKSLQSCPTLCDPIDGSPPGSPVPGILQARTLEWVAISFSNAGKWKVKVKSLSRVRLSATPWTAAYQAPPPMGFSRQEYWGHRSFKSGDKFQTTLQQTLQDTTQDQPWRVSLHFLSLPTPPRTRPTFPYIQQAFLFPANLRFFFFFTILSWHFRAFWRYRQWVMNNFGLRKCI